MKILISSHAFAPSLGGIETVSLLLAGEFVQFGNEVIVVTQTVGAGENSFPFLVVRQPSLGRLAALTAWCDVLWQNNLSLRTLWPALVLGRAVVVTHQGSYCRKPAGVDLAQRVKHAVVRRLPSVAISDAVAACFATRSVVIPNPYDASLFTPPRDEQIREEELIFLGRLVSEKGLDLLLEALAALRADSLFPRLTIVGAGPELRRNKELVEKLGLQAQVKFVGPKGGAELVALLQRREILVVPSRYAEPFGVVALEGIACGCVVLGSAGGGLPEAIGPCGVTFPNNDAAALARALEKLLRAPNERAGLRAQAAQHLAKHHPRRIAQAYLELFKAHLS